MPEVRTAAKAVEVVGEQYKGGQPPISRNNVSLGPWDRRVLDKAAANLQECKDHVHRQQDGRKRLPVESESSENEGNQSKDERNDRLETKSELVNFPARTEGQIIDIQLSEYRSPWTSWCGKQR